MLENFVDFLRDLSTRYAVLFELAKILVGASGGAYAVWKFLKKRYRKDLALKENAEERVQLLEASLKECAAERDAFRMRLPQTPLSTYDKETALGNYELAASALEGWLEHEGKSIALVAGRIGEHYMGFLTNEEAPTALPIARRHLQAAIAIDPSNTYWRDLLAESNDEWSALQIKNGGPLPLPEDDLSFAFARGGRPEELVPVVQRLGDRVHELIEGGHNISAFLLAQRGLRATERAFPNDSAAVLLMRHSLARCLHVIGRSAEAEALARSNLADMKRVFGPYDNNSLFGAILLAQIIQLGRDRSKDALEIAYPAWKKSSELNGKTNRISLLAGLLVSQCLLQLDREGEAEPIVRDTWQALAEKAGEGHKETLLAAQIYSQVLYKVGKYANAEAIAKATLLAFKRVAGADHPEALKIELTVVQAQLSQAKEESVSTAKQCLDDAIRIVGSKHPTTIEATYLYANALEKRGDLRDAERVARQSLAFKKSLYGDAAGTTLASAQLLALVLYKLREYFEAEKFCRPTYEARARVLGHTHRHTLVSGQLLAQIVGLGLRRAEEGRKIAEEVLQAQTQSLGPTHADTLCSEHVLAQILALRLNDYKPALDIALRTWSARKTHLGEFHPDTIRSAILVAQILSGLDKNAEAAKIAEEAYEKARRLYGDDHEETRSADFVLAQSLFGANQYQSAEVHARRLYDKSMQSSGVFTKSRFVYGDLLVRILEGMPAKLHEATALYQELLAKGHEAFGGADPDVRLLAKFWQERYPTAEAGTVH